MDNPGNSFDSLAAWLFGSLRWRADPPDLGLVIAGHIGLTVSTAVEDVKRLRLLCWQRLTQLRHHIGDDGTDTLFMDSNRDRTSSEI